MGDDTMSKKNQIANSVSTNRTIRRKATALWLAMLGLAAIAMPMASGCDEQELRQLAAQAQQAADDLDPWTKFCLINVSAEEFAACEAGHVE
jgi:uncharacterized membrane protein